MHNSTPNKQAKASPNIYRPKLRSLRFLNPKTFQLDDIRASHKQDFKKLEKSLERDNRQEQPLAEPTLVLPDEQIDIQDDTLWNLFEQQVSKVAGKVTGQRVNCYERQFLKLKKQNKQKIRETAHAIDLLEGSTKQKYKQIHSLFEEIKQQRTVDILRVSITKGKKSKKEDQLMIDNSSKVAILKESIEDLRKQVALIEKDIHQNRKNMKKVKHQWICFLRKMLRQEYYLKRGVIPILEQMIQAKYKPRKQDLPRCLDQISKRCLVQQYKTLSNTKPKYLHKRINSEPKSRINSLVQSELIRDVYKGTQQYMSEMIKQASWKQQLVLPPIHRLSNQEQHSDWRANQIKRLSHIYTGEKYNHSRSILFGPKVQTYG